MIAKTVDVSRVQTHFTELMSSVLEGTEVIFMQGNTPLARLLPIALSPKSRIAGLHSGAIWTSDDFDEPLPEKFWMGEET